MKFINTLTSSYLLIFTLGYFGYGQNFDEVTIKTTQVNNNIYMLEGAGGNIGVSVGDEGVFVIDDQFAPLTPKILAAIKEISPGEIKFLLNTHWHGDHSGGNENMEKAGAIIMAHHNVRKRLKETPQRDSTYRPEEALPIITYEKNMHVHINGEEVQVVHVPNAHTDGDSQLYFTESNVIHMGDTYFNGRYPYIDLSSGGSIDGYINASRNAIVMIDDNTKIIPGHGALSNKEELSFFFSMLVNIRDLVKKEIAAGKTEDEVANNSEITQVYDRLGYGEGFINSERFRRTIYQSLNQK
ncbi:MAG: MBL fold metallo-hydrolase [Flavobacteriaceae bacterium]|nr:MBL fold metallo-hydrolase [Flavobacteriaceae bacterium]